MSNPTFENSAQFISPYNILPDTIYINPTLNPGNQFISPFDILPNFDLTEDNPTFEVTKLQFKSPYNILPDADLTEFNPTLQAGNQFITFDFGTHQTFDILPNSDLTTFNPTFFQRQFITPLTLGNGNATFDRLPNDNLTGINPTFNASSQFETPRHLDGNLPFDNLITPRITAERTSQGTKYQWRGGENTNTFESRGAATLASNLAGRIGFPFASSVINTAFSNNGNTMFQTPYKTLPYGKLTTDILRIQADGNISEAINAIPSSLIEYWDFRSRITINRNEGVASILQQFGNIRADGAAAALRKNTSFGSGRLKINVRAGIYAATAASPAGAYSVFNRNASGIFGYGYGDHDNPYAIRNDFTLSSEVGTRWSLDRKWVGAIRQGAPDALLPFRGDKVNVIDFKRDTKLEQAYKWKPTLFAGENFLGRAIASDAYTQDFVKFYFTGPKLQNGESDQTDDIMVFRAIITQLNDSFNANWTPQQFIGRADPNYHYTGYSRDLSLGFDVYATTRDELKFIWRKLNALAGYTTPEYNNEDIALRAPWMRITVGDLFVQQPVVLNSLSYDYATDSSWEINIENDSTNMQVPFKISVSCQLNMITDYLPQKNGRFFTLAKDANAEGVPLEGNDNWLSDFLGNEPRKQQEIPPPRDASAPADTPPAAPLGEGQSNEQVAFGN